MMYNNNIAITQQLAILEIKNLSISFINNSAIKVDIDNDNKQTTNIFNIVNELNLTLYANKTLALVGQSGSGKTNTAYAVMRLLNNHAKLSGSIKHYNTHTKKYDSDYIVGKDVCMIFQEPLSALNPTKKVGQQILEVILRHQNISRQKAIQ